MTNANALPIQERLAFMANLLDHPADANLSQTCREAADRIDALEGLIRARLNGGGDDFEWFADARAALGEGE